MFLREPCAFPAEREPEGDAPLSGFSPPANLVLFVVYLAHLYFCAFGEAIFLFKMGPKCSVEGIFSIPKAEMSLQRNSVLGTLRVVPLAVSLMWMNQQHILNEIVLWFRS